MYMVENLEYLSLTAHSMDKRNTRIIDIIETRKLQHLSCGGMIPIQGTEGMT